jgi:hypothetical protein
MPGKHKFSIPGPDETIELNLTTGSITIADLFKDARRKLVPVFQRAYSWKLKDLNALRETIDECMEEALGKQQTFFGPIILQDCPDDYYKNTNFIVDGQQRMATCYLLLTKMTQALLDEGYEDQAEDLFRDYLVDKGGARGRGSENEARFIPTMADRKQFYEILDPVAKAFDVEVNSTEFPPSSDNAPNGNINKAATWCEDFVKGMRNKKDGSFDAEIFEAYLRCILHGLVMLKIGLTRKDDANSVFHRINYLGVELGVNDILRNIVLSCFADKPQEADKFNHVRYSKFEEGFRLHAKNKEPGDSERNGNLDDFINGYARIVTGGTSTTKTTINDIEKYWKRLKIKKDAGKQLEDLAMYAPFWKVFLGAEIPGAVNQKCRKKKGEFDELYRVCTSLALVEHLPFRPFMCGLLFGVGKGIYEVPEAIAIFKTIESFIYRRRLIHKQPLPGILPVCRKLEKKEWILDGETLERGKFDGFWKLFSMTRDVDFDELVDAKLKLDDKWRRMDFNRAILVNREYYERQKDRDNLPPLNTATVEHILPQKPKKGWEKSIAKEEWGHYIPQLGNLTLLSQSSQNIKNQTWDKKKAEFGRQSFVISSKLSSKSEWTAKEIDERTDELWKWIKKQWPEPPKIKVGEFL